MGRQWKGASQGASEEREKGWETDGRFQGRGLGGAEDVGGYESLEELGGYSEHLTLVLRIPFSLGDRWSLSLAI